MAGLLDRGGGWAHACGRDGVAETVVRRAEVTLHGHRISYREAGDPALPVLLLVHGITSSSATWDPVIPALAEHVHVIAPDLLGHGESAKPRADYSLGALASVLRDLLAFLGHDRAAVVGHSLGGGVALQFAYQYYQFCERMVLVSSGGLGREVSLALRAATLPGAELVLSVIASSHVRDAGLLVSRLVGRSVPVRTSAVGGGGRPRVCLAGRQCDPVGVPADAEERRGAGWSADQRGGPLLPG